MARKLFRADLLAARPSARDSVAHVLTAPVPSTYPKSGDLSQLYAEMEDMDGDRLPRGELQVDESGELPRFYGPDGVDTLYVLYADAAGPPYTAVELTGVTDPADGSATSVPTPADGDEGKLVAVSDPYTDGFELVDAPEGGSGGSVGAPCWFGGAWASNQVPGAAFGFPTWVDLDDGTTPGTDVVIAGDDATALEVVTAGTYLVTMVSGPMESSTGEDGVIAAAYIQLNDDAAGPAYYTIQAIPVVDAATFGGVQLATPVIPLVLATGDRLRLGVGGKAGSVPLNIGNGTAVLIRLG